MADDGAQHLNLQPTFENSVVGSKRFNYFDLELLRVSKAFVFLFF